MQRRALKRIAAIATLDEIVKNKDFTLNTMRYLDVTELPPVLNVEAELRALRETAKKRDEADARMNELLAVLDYRTP